MEFEQIELNPIFEKHYEEIMDFIQFTPAKFKAFKKLCAQTEKGGVFLFEGKEVLKIIYVPGRLVNIVVK